MFIRFYHLAAAGFCIIAFAACNNTSSSANITRQDTTATPVVPGFALSEGNIHSTLVLPGELQPFQSVDLYAKVNSFVKKMYVDVGSQVQQGQLLVTLDAPELETQIKAAASDLHTKEAIYNGSKATYTRLFRTSKLPGTVAPNDLETAYAKMSADSAELLAARSRYQLAVEMNNYLEIRAPFAGVISGRNVFPGAYVGPAGKGSDKPMLTLQEQSKLRLVVAVPEAAVPYLKDKDTVHFSVKPLPNQQFTAHISRMAGSMNPQFRTEQIEMDVQNTSRQLLPGMYAQVTLPYTNQQKTFVVPLTAVGSNSQTVFVIRAAGGKAQWVSVQKGREDADSTEIFGDLHLGDQLLLRASDEIRNGTAIRVK